jgi:imidazole glycerol-phosphate synthase subunit HisH
MITLVNYGLGNIHAFANIFHRLNIPVAVANTSDELAKAKKIILPGVGAFDWAMAKLNGSGMRDCLDEMVLGKKHPILGVCVGMQMMAKRSDEGELPGLGWIDAEVKKFDVACFNQKTHLPHMGWNIADPKRSDGLFRGLEKDARFYFLHSYYIAPASVDAILSETDYCGAFASAVRVGNVMGTQFHPEKSHQWGIQLLKNFADL